MIRPIHAHAHVPIRFLVAFVALVVACEPAPQADGADAPEGAAGPARTVTLSWDSIPLLDSLDGPPVWSVGAEALGLATVSDAVAVAGGAVAVAGRGPAGSEAPGAAAAAPRRVVVVDTASGKARPVPLPDAVAGPAPPPGPLHDEGGGRVGMFDPAGPAYVTGAPGGSVETVPLERFGLPPSATWRRGTGEGFWAAALAETPADTAGRRAAVPLVRVRGGAPDTVAALRAQAVYRSPRGPAMILFGPSSALAPAADGGVWVGDMAAPEVTRLDAHGRPVVVVRWSGGPDRTLGPDRLDRFLEPLFRAYPERLRGAARRQLLESMPVPDSVPAFQHLLVDRQGRLWVGSYVAPEVADLPRPDRPQAWLLVGGDGTPLGRVVTPPGFRLTDAGAGWVLGVEDRYGAPPRVHVYPLDPGLDPAA